MSALMPCPFCGAEMQFRKALWPSDGCTDAVIHAEPSECGMVGFDLGTTDEGVLAAWNRRAADPAAPLPEPVAWLHTVKQNEGDEEDLALSFAPDNFPLMGEAPGLFQSIRHEPLFTASALPAAAPLPEPGLFEYTRTFNAIAAATSCTQGGFVAISVRAFREAFGPEAPPPDPVAWLREWDRALSAKTRSES